MHNSTFNVFDVVFVITFIWEGRVILYRTRRKRIELVIYTEDGFVEKVKGYPFVEYDVGGAYGQKVGLYGYYHVNF